MRIRTLLGPELAELGIHAIRAQTAGDRFPMKVTKAAKCSTSENGKPWAEA